MSSPDTSDQTTGTEETPHVGPATPEYWAQGKELQPRREWTWVCEYCFTTTNETNLPSNWDWVFQSAICPKCRPRVLQDGGINRVKGGAYADGKPDPRAVPSVEQEGSDEHAAAQDNTKSSLTPTAPNTEDGKGDHLTAETPATSEHSTVDGPMENLLRGLDEQSGALSYDELRAELAARGIDSDASTAEIEAKILGWLRDNPLPCPFPSCDSRNGQQDQSTVYVDEERGGGYVAKCRTCCGGTGSFHWREAALDEWNQLARAVLRGSSDPSRVNSSAVRASPKESSAELERSSTGGEEGEPKVHLVQIRLCELCLAGKGDECHTPGCALCFHNSPGHPIHRELYEFAPIVPERNTEIEKREWRVVECETSGKSLIESPNGLFRFEVADDDPEIVVDRINASLRLTAKAGAQDQRELLAPQMALSGASMIAAERQRQITEEGVGK